MAVWPSRRPATSLEKADADFKSRQFFLCLSLTSSGCEAVTRLNAPKELLLKKCDAPPRADFIDEAFCFGVESSAQENSASIAARALARFLLINHLGP